MTRVLAFLAPLMLAGCLGAAEAQVLADKAYSLTSDDCNFFFWEQEAEAVLELDLVVSKGSVNVRIMDKGNLDRYCEGGSVASVSDLSTEAATEVRGTETLKGGKWGMALVCAEPTCKYSLKATLTAT